MRHRWTTTALVGVALLAIGLLAGRALFRGRGAAVDAGAVDRRTAGPCAASVDGDGDAAVDGVADSNWTHHYDAGDRLARVTTDYGPDGVIDAVARFGYDDAGRRVREWYDCDADGEPEEAFRYAFDEAGRPRLAVIDKLDGHAEHCGSVEAHAGSPRAGGVKRRPLVDRRIDWVASLEALGAAELAARGAPDAAVLYVYDAAGVLVREEWDMDGDGVVEELIHFVYDPHGNLRWEYHDDGPDGEIDVSVTYDHACWADAGPARADSAAVTDEARPSVEPAPSPDAPRAGAGLYEVVRGRDAASLADGAPREPCGAAWDLDSDGDVDGYTLHTVADGRIVAAVADWDADGRVDNRFRYGYDDRGRRVTEEWDTALDGSLAERLTIRYAADGRRAGGDIDAGADGTIDGEVRYLYDDDGRLASERWDKDGDGAVDEVVTYGYDPHGRLDAARYDMAGGTDDDERVRFLYACDGIRIE